MAKATDPTFSEAQRAELLRLIAGLRAAIGAAVSLDAPVERLRALADQAEALGAGFAPHAGKKPMDRYSRVDPGDPNSALPYSPITGRFSPIAPPVEISLEGESPARIIGTVRFGDAYEGPPSSVHGGVIASVYDQILALANIANGVGGPTASLTVHYRRLTPLHTELRFEAWTDRIDGRKIWARGECRAGSELISEGEGLFVRFDAERATRAMPGLEVSEGATPKRE